MIARITIVGRPNVGKSSLFNVLSGHKIAIVSDTENTTRDIVEYQMHDEENHISYILADSGGITIGTDDAILSDIRNRVQESITRSDLILFVLEYDKLTALDEEIAKLLRKSGKKVIIVANKADNIERMNESYALASLGFDDFVITSTAHDRGLDILKLAMVHNLKENGLDYEEAEYDDGVLKLAIIGRPNVGKSSLINALTGTNRAMVRDMPGTTRDSIDSIIEWNGEKIVLIDTAGIRRSGKIGSANLEQWSVMRSERSITRADLVAIVIDADEGITSQDKHVVERALEEKKGIILVCNKWDKILARPTVQTLEEREAQRALDKAKSEAEKEKKLRGRGNKLPPLPESPLKSHNRAPEMSSIDERYSGSTIMNRYIEYINQEFDFISYVTPIFTSAIDGKRVDAILDIAFKIRDERNKRVKTGVFNDFLSQITYQHAPTGNRKAHKPKIYYGSQVDVNPPKFMISVNNESHFHFSYKRYIENRIREFFGFVGTPINVELKGRESIFKKGGGIKDERLKDDAERHHEELTKNREDIERKSEKKSAPKGEKVERKGRRSKKEEVEEYDE
ncbi:ribosome biogenesis GTPase Der [Candidatus Gracilibacteria bacterium CG2_30_37_12]|nr:MAG: ribosome biogenesis GTPase Der [Candidatus Gracilibacteria bacterium CG2_30_37_12]